jgi:hypothetical protein
MGTIASAGPNLPTPPTGSNMLKVVSSNQWNIENKRGSFSGGCVLFRVFIPELGSVTIPAGDGRVGLITVHTLTNVAHLSLTFDTTRHLELRLGSTSGSIIATSSNAIGTGDDDRWVEIRAKWSIADSGGTMEVFVDGTSTGWINYTGDTRNGSTADWYYCQFFGHGGSDSHIDDVMLFDSDTSDAGNNLTDCAVYPQPRIASLLPEAGNGANATWTRSTGADGGVLVNEVAPNGDTNYNTSSTTGQKDTYTLPSIGNVTVWGTTLLLQVRKTAGGAVTSRPIYRSGGTDYFGASFSPTTNYGGTNGVAGTLAYLSHCYDPATGVQWTTSGINALEVGIEYTSGSDPLRLSRVRLEVAYTGAPPEAVDDDYSTPFDTTLIVPADGVLTNDDDAGSPPMTAVLDTDVSNGTLSLSSDGSFTYVPDYAFYGEDTFTYTANTSAGESNVATVTITVEEPDPPDGGGGTGEGNNPPEAEFPTGILRLFFEMKVGNTSPATIVTGGETMMRDPDSWYGGKKPPRILSISPIERELTSDGSFRGSEVRLVVADVDRVFRTLATTDTISGCYLAIYVVSDTVRYALGEPYRLFAGHVYSHQALSGFKYELVVRDVLSERIAELDDAPRVPPDRLSVADFPGMDAQYEGRAVPLVVGFCSDESESGTIAQDPQGVIPPVILGRVNFTYWGGINQEVIACIWSQSAVALNGIRTVYYNPLDTPDQRIEIPLASYGVDVWTPGFPGWTDTGLATDYVDYPLPLSALTRRYTPFFARADQPLAQAFLEGKVLVAANMSGVAENSDGTGLYLDDAPRVWQWLILNQLFSPYKTGEYADVPEMGDVYSIIDTESVENTTQRLRGFLGSGSDYPVGFLLGRDGTQQTLRHVLGELCAGVLMDQGLNRHGQLMVDVEDVDAEATVSLSDLFDIEDGEFAVWVDQSAYRNRIEYVYGRRYVAPSAPPATPPEGDPLPAQPLMPYYEWTSGLRVIENAPAIAAFGERKRTMFLENYVVRNSDVADNVAARILQRLSGPSPSFDGPHMFRLRGTWPLLQCELGTVIAIDHIEGMGPTGYEGTRGRVTKISVDGQPARITLEGRILDGLGELGSPA